MQENGILNLEWRYCDDGYQVVRGSVDDAKPSNFLVCCGKFGIPSIPYFPLTHEALFKEFSTIAQTSEGILNFASKYGELGIRIAFRDADSGNVKDGEPISAWLTEIKAMHTVISLWDAINEENLDVIQEHIKWKDEHTLTAPGATIIFGRRLVRATSEWVIYMDEERIDATSNSQFIEPALAYIEYVINNRLDKRFSMRMFRKAGRLQLLMEPVGLIGALWLQCARAISQCKDFRACVQCGNWFEVSATDTKKKFCTTACRLKSYRNRIAEAQKLSEQGKSPANIAKILGTDTKTVRGWLKQGGAKK